MSESEKVTLDKTTEKDKTDSTQSIKMDETAATKAKEIGQDPLKADEVDKNSSTKTETVTAPPKPQRKIRLNRRGFYDSNNQSTDVLSKDSVTKPSDVNGSNAPPKKVISLISVKRNLPEQTLLPAKGTKIASLKKSDTEKREITKTIPEASSSEGPARKKHKPITWP